jgi:tetratricopeptide (TPR) repeat protein
VETAEVTRLEAEIEDACAGGDLERARALARSYCAQAHTKFGWRALYLAAQVNLACGQLHLAACIAGALLPLSSTTPRALACRVWLLQAEALTRLHLHEAGRHCLDRALAFPDILQDQPLLRLRELRIRLWLGDLKELRPLLDDCGQQLEEANDFANLALLCCEEGRAWEADGDMECAEAHWRRAERLSRGLGADPIRADVLVQLGRLEHLRGDLQGALDFYDAAQACQPAPPQQSEVHLRRALVLLELNQEARACGERDQALAGDATPEALPEEIRGLASMVGSLLQGSTAAGHSPEMRGWLALEADNAEEARLLYTQAHAEAHGAARRARLALALGLLAVTAGDRREARRWLGQAEEAARKELLPEVLWRSLQGRGRLAAELEDDDEQARKLFEEAVALAEDQSRRLRHATDAASHRLHRAGVLRQLLHAACRRRGGNAEDVFRYQELERGRLLWEMWRSTACRSKSSRLGDNAALEALEKEIAACEGGSSDSLDVLRRRDELLRRRDRLLDDFLRDRSRRGDNALPPIPDLHDLQQVLPADTAYIAPILFEDEIYLLCARCKGATQVRKVFGPARRLRNQLGGWRNCVAAQLHRYRSGFSLGCLDRNELDKRLAEIGEGDFGVALQEVLGDARRLVWAPDHELHGFPIHAMRRAGRYFIEDYQISYAFGGALLVHQARAPRRRRWGRAFVVADDPTVLPHAAREAEGVAASFSRSLLMQGPQATRAALRRNLPSAAAAHFACHAFFDAEHPMAAAVRLPSGETWRALEFLGEKLEGLPLVTLGACRSAEVSPLVGREVFGLVTSLLASGVRAVVAGLWPVTDRETVPLMWRFYRHRLGCDLATAMAKAQRETLAQTDSSPLFWAPFALFGDSEALPAPPRWLYPWARWRQRRHALRFPTPLTIV